MDPTGKESIIAQGTAFKGVVTSDCPLTVSGQLDGEITAPTLVVTESGSVSGKILVDDLRSEGEVAGQIEARNLQLSGRVRTDTSIRAETLEVKLDAAGTDKLAVTFGTVDLEVGTAPEPELEDAEDEEDDVAQEEDAEL